MGSRCSRDDHGAVYMLGTTKPEGINKSDVVDIWVQCEKKGIPDCRGQGQNVEVNA